MDELISFNADVLCLQEVDNYDNWWRPQLQAAGYDGLFVKRGGRHKDGVATMFLRSKVSFEIRIQNSFLNTLVSTVQFRGP